VPVYTCARSTGCYLGRRLRLRRGGGGQKGRRRAELAMFRGLGAPPPRMLSRHAQGSTMVGSLTTARVSVRDGDVRRALQQLTEKVCQDRATGPNPVPEASSSKALPRCQMPDVGGCMTGPASVDSCCMSTF
jgi:hypothetical protein